MVEEIGIGLVDGLCAVDHDLAGGAACGDGGHHSDAVVIVRIDLAAGKGIDALDDEVVTGDAHLRAQRGKLAGGGDQTVRLLDAQARAVTDECAALRQRCHGRDDGHQVGNVVGAHLKAGKFVGLYGGGVGGTHDAGSKARKRGEHVTVALCGAQRHALHGDGIGADGAGTQPKGSVGPVTLDGHAAGRAVRAAAHAEVRDLGLAVLGRNTLDVDLDAKGLHGLDRQVDIGTALDEAGHLHAGGLGQQRGCQQQAGDILRAYVARKHKGARAHAAARYERKTAQALQVATGGDDLIRERGERAGAQAALTHEGCFRAQRAGDGQHKAQCGAALSAVECAAGKGLEQAKFNALHGGVDLEAVLDGLDASAERREAAHRGLDIGAGGIAGDVRLAVGECGADDQAVRHRLGRDGGNSAFERGGGDAG